MPGKRIPLRKCLGCNEMKPKHELIRVVKSKDGNVNVDIVGKMSGRGAYVCKRIDCLRKAIKSRRLDRAFSCKISDEIYDSLEEELSESE